MTSAGFYEETIVLKDIKIEEINKFYISEDLSDNDRVNFILKKGQPSQRSTLISNLPTIVQNIDMTSHIVTNVIEDIELWNKEIQICFAIALNETVREIAKRQLRGKNYASLISMIIFHYMKSIVNLEKNMSDEYALNFNEMVTYLNEHFRVTLTNELIEYSTSLGKFGQSNANRKFSVYFCASLLRIANEYKEELYRRFLILCGDAERIVKLEVSYEIRYLLQEMDEYFCKKSFCPILEGYLKENDMLIRSEAIVSIILNIHKFEINFVNKVIITVSEIFENEDSFSFSSEFNLYIKIFTNVIEQVSHNIFFQKTFLKLIKGFLKKYFLNYAYDTKNACVSQTNFQYLNLHPSSSNLTSAVSLRYDYIIEKFHLIALILRNQGEINFLIDLFSCLIKQIFENGSEMNQSSSQTTSTNNCIQKTSSIITSEPDYKLIFCDNFYKISGELNKQIINKNFLMKFLQIFQEDELSYIIPHVLKNFDKLLFSMKEIDHEDFFTYIFSNLSQIEIHMKNLKDWRTVQTIIRGLCDILDYASQVIGRFAHEEFFTKLIAMVKGYLKPNVVLGIQVESIRLLVQLIKFSKNSRAELIKFAAVEFLNGQKSYYRRRLYRVFIDECFEVFSVSYVKEIGVWSNYISMLSDIPLIVCNLLKVLPKIFPLVSQEEELDKQLNALFQANSQNMIKDSELSKSIQDLSDWLELYKIHSKIKSAYQEIYMKDKIKMNDERKIRERENVVITQTDVKEKKEDPLKRQLLKPSMKKTFTNSSLSQVSNGSNFNLHPIPSSSAQSFACMSTRSQSKKGQTNFGQKTEAATMNYNSASNSNKQSLPVITRIAKKWTSDKVDKGESRLPDSLESAKINSLKSQLSKSFKKADLSYENSYQKVGLSNPGIMQGNETKFHSPRSEIMAKAGLKGSFDGVGGMKSPINRHEIPYMSLNSPKTLPKKDPVLSLSSSLGIKHYQTSNNTIVSIKVKSNTGKAKITMK